MWINTDEEVVFKYSGGHIEAKGYIALWEREHPTKVADSEQNKRKYYTFRLTIKINGFSLDSYGEKGTCAQRNTVKYGYKKNAVSDMMGIVESLKIV